MKTIRILIIGLVATSLLFLGVAPVGAQDEEPEPQNPVVEFLAGVTGSTPEAIAGLQQQGYGLGNISKAYYYQQNGGSGDLKSIIDQARETGWGQLFKSAGLHPGGGLGWLFKANGQHGPKDKTTGWTPPGQAKKNNGWLPPGQQKKKDKGAGETDD